MECSELRTLVPRQAPHVDAPIADTEDPRQDVADPQTFGVDIACLFYPDVGVSYASDGTALLNVACAAVWMTVEISAAGDVRIPSGSYMWRGADVTWLADLFGEIAEIVAEKADAERALNTQCGGRGKTRSGE